MAARWDKTPGVAGRIAEAAARISSGTVGTFASADGRIWHAAGATEAQELSAVLATVVALVRHAGLSPDSAMAGIGVALAADVDPFLTIAKVRAARLLLLRLAEVLETSSVPAIHAETAWRVMSKRKRRLNALRAAAAALAAASGGAATITVLPYDTALVARDADAARLARNTHAILANEARLADVADPAAGSGAIEATTDALAAAAWQRFQALEAAGGIIAEIVAGSLQPEIAKARRARLDRVARSETAIIGVNAHVDGAAPTRAAPDDSPDTVLTFVRLPQAFEGAEEIVS
jgi:methylmalonyl-CoA mutase